MQPGKLGDIRKVDVQFWKNKKVFLTGHTGFKGAWLSMWLIQMGANLKGFSLSPNTSPNLFEVALLNEKMTSEIGDIRNFHELNKSIVDFQPEVIFHLAAQPLVRESYLNPLITYETNVMGTANLLESCRNVSSLKSVIIVTTDKCYENKEWEWGYRENEPMGGYDPYSSSKGCVELITSAYRRSFFNLEKSPSIATARAGNVIGGGDWSVDRLIPDIIKSFNNREKVLIRNPMSTRPWQHVLEPLSGYLMLAESIFEKSNNSLESFNFGPFEEGCKSVQWILENICENWIEAPGWEKDININPHEATFLKLDISKAKTLLNWTPRWTLKESLKSIIEWNTKFKGNENMYNHSISIINKYNDL